MAAAGFGIGCGNAANDLGRVPQGLFYLWNFPSTHAFAFRSIRRKEMRKLLIALAAILAVGFAMPVTSGPAEAKHGWKHHHHHHGMAHHNRGRHLGWTRGRHRGWAHSHHRHH
jgi:hypothetical protein